MRFRKTSRAAGAAVAIDHPLAPMADDVHLPMVDATGYGFQILRSLDLGHGLWRTNTVAELEHLDRRQIIIVAAYSPQDIDAAWPLMQRFMTIVLAIGPGPQYGSRALSLGAVGYVDATADQDDIRGVFGDAVSRARTRRVREAPA